MNNKDLLLGYLVDFNLSQDEARVYIELLEGSNTHQRLARQTGINRTKVYRLAEDLTKRGLIARRTDDRGTFLVANDPAALEVDLITQEGEARRRRAVLKQAIPMLRSFHKEAKSPFAIHTYEGVEGLKQMLWHELKTKGELLVFGNSSTQEISGDEEWSEKWRLRVIESGYRTKEIYNDSLKKPDFTKNQKYLDLHEARRVLERDLPVANSIIIYNDTVAVYQFHDEKRVGVEIINTEYARTMRCIFEHYWRLGETL